MQFILHKQKLKILVFIVICQIGSQLFAQGLGKNLTINISNIKIFKGLIRIEVYKNESDYNKETNQFREGSFPAIDSVATITFKNIPKGFYAIMIYHDINGNDQNDVSSLGVPLEPFGFSNNIKPNFSIPKFGKTKFQILEDDIEMNIALQQYEKNWGVGIASEVSFSPYRNSKSRIFAIPIIIYQGENLEILGPNASYSLWSNQKFDFSLDLRLNYEGYNSSDSPVLNGMADRKITIEGGFDLQYHLNQQWNIKTDVYYDILGVSDGMNGSISIENKTAYEKWQFSPSIGLKWEDQSYADYYFGVQSSEATFNRPEFHPKFSFNPYIEVETIIYWSDNWASLITISGTYLDKNIQDSPLVGNKFYFGLITAFVYRF